MKVAIRLFFVFCMITVVSCKEKSHEKDHGHDAEAPDATAEESPNIALHNEVMKIHDEVMPKMQDIYEKKEELKNKIANTPNMPAATRQAIEAKIARLDSANDGMFKWMHNFRPVPDSVGEEKARVYLENEMEKVKKVRADILQALEEANQD